MYIYIYKYFKVPSSILGWFLDSPKFHILSLMKDIINIYLPANNIKKLAGLPKDSESFFFPQKLNTLQLTSYQLSPL